MSHKSRTPLLTACLFILLTISANGATYTVTRSEDFSQGFCSAGDCTLRDAVLAANQTPEIDFIDFYPGLSVITLINEIVITAGSGSLTIVGPGANVLTIDGGEEANRIFYNSQNTVLTISGMKLTGGNGQGHDVTFSGGAIYSAGSLNLDNVVITGNNAEFGGAIFSTGTLMLNNAEITDNAANWGGAVAAIGSDGPDFFSSAKVKIVNSTVSGNNSGTEGGGVACQLCDLVIANSTISGNQATTNGGALFGSGARAELRNTTITANLGVLGSGIYLQAMPIPDGFSQRFLDFGNSVIAGNGALGSHEIDLLGDVLAGSSGGNLIGDNPGDSNSFDTPIFYHASDVRDVNPMLGPLQDNGGPTPTHALLAGSPAIDHGADFLAVDPANGSSLTTDQRGETRILDGDANLIPVVDTGAFEFRIPLADPAVSLGVNNNYPKQGDLLTFTITVTNSGGFAAENVVVNNVLSSGTTFLSARASKGTLTTPPSGQTGTVTWYLGDLNSGGQESAQVDVTVLVKGRTTITNTAMLSSDGTDRNMANNSASITVSVASGSGGGGKKK